MLPVRVYEPRHGYGAGRSTSRSGRSSWRPFVDRRSASRFCGGFGRHWHLVGRSLSPFEESPTW